MYGLLANKYCHKVKSYVSFLIPLTPLTKIETKQAFPWSALASFLGCQGSCGIVRNEIPKLRWLLLRLLFADYFYSWNQVWQNFLLDTTMCHPLLPATAYTAALWFLLGLRTLILIKWKFNLFTATKQLDTLNFKLNKDKSKFIQTNFENFHSSELVRGQWSAVGIFRKMYILIIYR